MRTWLITGGAGFIGSSLARAALEEKDVRVVVLDLLTYAGHRESLAELEGDPRFAFVQGDIADPETVASVFRQHRPSALLHLAAESHVDRSIDGPRAFVRTNVVGTHELLEAARAHVAALSGAGRADFRFLLVSTDEVYGSIAAPARFTEASPYDPRSPYAATKAAADHLTSAYHETYGLPTIITNCSNNYGPRQFPEKLIPLMVLNAVEGRPLPVYGDGGNVRDWIHVEDHVRGVLVALERGRPGETYVFGADGERTNLQVVEAVCAALERLRPAAANRALAARGARAYRDLITFVQDRPGHDRRYAIDAAKARRDLGWAPRRSFEQGIEETVAWYLAHAAWCEAVQAKGYRRERLGTARATEAR